MSGLDKNVGFICGHGINGYCFISNYVCEKKTTRCVEIDPFDHCFLDFYSYCDLYAGVDDMIELIARLRSKTVEAEASFSILDLAIKHDIPWLFSCTHGTCARCRCLISEG